MSDIFFNTTEFYKHHSLSFCTTTLFGTKKTSFYPVQKLSDYLRRKEDWKSLWWGGRRRENTGARPGEGD